MTLNLTPDTTLRVKVTYNDETIFEQDLEGGKEHNIHIETPPVTGEAKTFFVIDGEDIPVSVAKYTYDEEPADGADDGTPNA